MSAEPNVVIALVRDVAADGARPVLVGWLALGLALVMDASDAAEWSHPDELVQAAVRRAGLLSLAAASRGDA